MKGCLGFVYCLYTLFLIGCTTTLPLGAYQPSFETLDTLKALRETSHPIALGHFSNANVPRQLWCELNQITPGNQESYANYIKQALQEELVYYQLYNPDAEVTLSASLDQMSMKATPSKSLGDFFSDRQRTDMVC